MLALYLDQVLLWRFGSWDRIGRLLDFASGFGTALVNEGFVQRAAAHGRYWPLAGGTVPEILLGVRDLQVKWLTYALNGCEQASRAFEASVGEETAFLTGRLRAMEASRFWKLRNLWFRLKRALGITDQE